MSKRLIHGLVLLVAAVAPALGDEISVSVVEQPDGSRMLTHAVQVPAPAAEVWAAFATEDGFESWAVPFARIDFRVGGEIETSYRLDAAAGDEGNIRNRILAYLPGRMLALQAVAAPPGFPAPEVLEQLFSVVEIVALGEEATGVRIHGIGYRNDPAHDQVLTMFREANRWSLQQLLKRFREGPVDWTALRTPTGGD